VDQQYSQSPVDEEVDEEEDGTEIQKVSDKDARIPSRPPGVHSLELFDGLSKNKKARTWKVLQKFARTPEKTRAAPSRSFW